MQLPISGFATSGYDVAPDGRFLLSFPPPETQSGDKTLASELEKRGYAHLGSAA